MKGKPGERGSRDGFRELGRSKVLACAMLTVPWKSTQLNRLLATSMGRCKKYDAFGANWEQLHTTMNMMSDKKLKILEQI